MTFTWKIVVSHLKCVGDKCAYNHTRWVERVVVVANSTSGRKQATTTTIRWAEKNGREREEKSEIMNRPSQTATYNEQNKAKYIRHIKRPHTHTLDLCVYSYVYMCFAYSFISSFLSSPCCSLACTRRLFYPTTHTNKCARVLPFLYSSWLFCCCRCLFTRLYSFHDSLPII